MNNNFKIKLPIQLLEIFLVKGKFLYKVDGYFVDFLYVEGRHVMNAILYKEDTVDD